MTASQRDIAERMGISVSAVSLALRNSPRVSEETRQRVLELARELSYPIPVAEGPTPVRQVAFVTQFQLSNQFFAEILSGAEMECRLHNIHLRYTQIATLADFQPTQFSGVDGLLLAGEMEEEVVQALMALDKPLVLVEHNLAYLPLDRVLVENIGGMQQIVQRLYRLGHRKIGFLCSGQPVTSFHERRFGYQQTMADLNLEPVMIVCQTAEVDSGELAMSHWLANPDRPQITALIGCLDALAVGALHALQQAGLRVPEDISVTGFDDVNIAREVRPALSTCRVPRELLGQLAVRQFLNRLQEPDAPFVGLLVPTEWVERASVR